MLQWQTVGPSADTSNSEFEQISDQESMPGSSTSIEANVYSLLHGQEVQVDIAELDRTGEGTPDFGGDVAVSCTVASK